MKDIHSILLYVDGELDPALLDRVVHVAEATGAKLTLGAVVESARSQVLFARGSLDLDEVERLLVEDRRRQLDEVAASIDDLDVSIATHVLLGDPAEAITRAVIAGDYDLVLKQPEPAHGLHQHLFGSTDMRLMRACPCPVTIVHLKSGGYSQRAVVAVDHPAFDDPTEHETQARLNETLMDSVAFGLATVTTEVHILHAWSMYGETLLAHGRGRMPPEQFKRVLEAERAKRQAWLEDLVEGYGQALEESRAALFNPKLELLRGDPTVVIPQRIKELDADLLSIGTASRRGLKGRLIGNTAETILGRINCSVVTLKPEGFVSPVSAV